MSALTCGLAALLCGFLLGARYGAWRAKVGRPIPYPTITPLDVVLIVVGCIGALVLLARAP